MSQPTKGKSRFEPVPWSFISGFNKGIGIRERRKPLWKRFRIKIIVLNPRILKWVTAPASADVIVASTYTAQEALQRSSHS